MALFRLHEFEGDILIDDIALRNVGLHQFRSKISIIPQEPVLFSGTVRKNLDPFDEFPDDVLWNALDEVCLFVCLNKSFIMCNTVDVLLQLYCVFCYCI